MRKTEEELVEFMNRVRAGEVPDVIDASAHFAGICMGDLRPIGWASKETTRSSMYWIYTGPNSIRVAGKELKTGDCTEEIDMDWT